jgi:transglutaminase-like putative cysteine protease
VTLVVTAPASLGSITALDSGARAWGTLQNRSVNAQACPATLTPDTLGGQPMNDYLKPTLDADGRDEYVSKLAGQLCPNPATKSFEYVRTLGYEAYKGSLRGARGTQWSGAGNSLDKSSLLIATLRSNGIPARYRHGTLSTERVQELILSMFPLKTRVVGYVPPGAEVSDPANDQKLLAEAQDHWWVEAFQNGTWVAMDPSFSYAAPGQTFTTPQGDPLAEVPDNLRHKVTFTLETERYDMLSYLSGGLYYTNTLEYTFTTAELVGQPVTLKHLVSRQTPPMGCMIFCWTHYTYIPYLRVGDSEWIVEGHPFWELLSDYPFGQFAITAEWLHFDVKDADGHTRRYTRQLADRLNVGPRTGPLRGPRQILGLMTKDVLTSLGPGAPSLVHEWDNHAIYFNPSLMSKEYAAHVGENLLAVTPRILSVQPIVSGLGAIDQVMRGEQIELLPKMRIVNEVAQDSVQAFNRMQGAAFVTFSDDASRDLAETGLVRVYPDSARITMVSAVISPTRVMSEAVQLQMMDLVYDSVRTIAYPGQAKGAEPTFRLTRGMNEAFLEKMVGEQMTGQPVKSGAGVLQAANVQGILLVYVDAEHLESLALAQISQQAKARIVDAAMQGYGILVPEKMVTWNGELAIAWWQVDRTTGEVIDVSEDGTHSMLIIGAGLFEFMIYMTMLFFYIRIMFDRFQLWREAAQFTWDYYWQVAVAKQNPQDPLNPRSSAKAYSKALLDTKTLMNGTVWDRFERACNEAGVIPIFGCGVLK